MRNQSSYLAAVITAAIFLFTAGIANAQGVLYVKDNKVGIGEPDPTGARLTIKADDGTGAGFKVITENVPAPGNWFFSQNPATGAFLISNQFGGAAQFQIFRNIGGNNPPSTFVIKNGSIGFGTQNAGANTLYVADGKSTSAPAWTVRSSKRYKENIEPLDGALGKIEQLRGVSYDLRATGKGSIGFIAEEVGEILPELVQYEDNGVDALTLDYDKMTALLVEAVKEQQQQIKELQRQLDAVQTD